MDEAARTLIELDELVSSSTQSLFDLCRQLDLHFSTDFSPWFLTQVGTSDLASSSLSVYLEELMNAYQSSVPHIGPFIEPLLCENWLLVPDEMLLRVKISLARNFRRHSECLWEKEIDGSVLTGSASSWLGLNGSGAQLIEKFIYGNRTLKYSLINVFPENLEFSKYLEPSDLTEFAVHAMSVLSHNIQDPYQRIVRSAISHIPGHTKQPSEQVAEIVKNSKIDFVSEKIPCARLDVKSLMANERTFLTWLNVTLAVGAVGIVKGADQSIGILLVTTALFFLWGSLFSFVKRARTIRDLVTSTSVENTKFPVFFGLILWIILLQEFAGIIFK